MGFIEWATQALYCGTLTTVFVAVGLALPIR